LVNSQPAPITPSEPVTTVPEQATTAESAATFLPSEPTTEPVTTSAIGNLSPEPETATGFWQSLKYEQTFLVGLLLTWVIEIPVAVVIIKYLMKRQEIGIIKIIFVGLVASGLTLPYLWFVLPLYVSNNFLYLVSGELLVVIVETLIYSQFLKLKLIPSFTVSLVANIASTLIGMLL
ncbi:MAG: hypothetical protein PHE50_03525, partial [Dehalococcoidales bacterium]|nr:hypothetical protein [Dehalococcoidales bacterium]